MMMARRSVLLVSIVLLLDANARVGADTPGAKRELVQVVDRALEATRAARKSIPRGRAAGTYEYRVDELSDGRLRTRVRERGYLRVAFSGSKDFMLFQPTEGDPEPEYDARIYVIDGGAILHSYFSPKIHPYGGHGRILPLALYAHLLFVLDTVPDVGSLLLVVGFPRFTGIAYWRFFFSCFR